jgi:hypothetical protein
VWAAGGERKVVVLVHGQFRCVAGSDLPLCVDKGLFPSLRPSGQPKVKTLWFADEAGGPILQSPLIASGTAKSFGTGLIYQCLAPEPCGVLLHEASAALRVT